MGAKARGGAFMADTGATRAKAFLVGGDGDPENDDLFALMGDMGSPAPVAVQYLRQPATRRWTCDVRSWRRSSLLSLRCVHRR